MDITETKSVEELKEEIRRGEIPNTMLFLVVKLDSIDKKMHGNGEPGICEDVKLIKERQITLIADIEKIKKTPERRFKAIKEWALLISIFLAIACSTVSLAITFNLDRVVRSSNGLIKITR